MKALIQRVSNARVDVAGETVGAIDAGLLLLLGVDAGDDEAKLNKLVDKVLRYRVFADDQQRMNLSLLDTCGELLVVSQFTLSANTQKGLRPSFASSAPPELARRLYDQFVERCRERVAKVETGIFAADMQVSLVNDGPVTFWLET